MEKMTCSNILRTLSIQSKILFIVLFFSVVIIQAQEKDYKRYNEKSGIIEYKEFDLDQFQNLMEGL